MEKEHDLLCNKVIFLLDETIVTIDPVVGW